jgi:hypothetical protein
MLEPHSSPTAFKWRRTALTRIDGAVDIAEDDWSLMIDGMSAGRAMQTATARRARLAKRSCGRWETPKRRNRRAVKPLATTSAP